MTSQWHLSVYSKHEEDAVICIQKGAIRRFIEVVHGMLLTFLAESEGTGGRFSLIEGCLKPGNEPPPHVHEREDELFYVLEGKMDVYVGNEVFNVGAGECLFLPKLKPHTFVVRSPRLRNLVLFV